jgi:hypothetical protein
MTNKSSSSLASGPYSLTSVSFRMIAHTDLSSAIFLHLVTPIGFRSFSIHSNHLNFGLLALPDLQILDKIQSKEESNLHLQENEHQNHKEI